MNTNPPALPELSPRAQHIIDVAREMTEDVGWENLTMRSLADRVGVKAPSLYKHTANKDELRAQLTLDTLMRLGYSLRSSQQPDGSFTLRGLMGMFRYSANKHPELYRMITTGTTSCETLQTGQWRLLLQETARWVNIPLATISPNLPMAYAAWSSTYGLCNMEITGALGDERTADMVWESVIAIYQPHFDAAARLRSEGYEGMIDTLAKPAVVEASPVDHTELAEELSRQLVDPTVFSSHPMRIY